MSDLSLAQMLCIVRTMLAFFVVDAARLVKMWYLAPHNFPPRSSLWRSLETRAPRRCMIEYLHLIGFFSLP